MHRTIDSLISGQVLYSVRVEDTVLDAARFMTEKRVGAALVLDEDKLVGIFSERDLMTRVVVAGLDPATTRVSDVMTPDVIAGVPGDTFAACIDKMHRHKCRHLPICDEGRPVGVLSLRDLLQVEASENQEEIKHLTSYVYSAGLGPGT
jgi:CBS domain-containing protein